MVLLGKNDRPYRTRLYKSVTLAIILTCTCLMNVCASAPTEEWRNCFIGRNDVVTLEQVGTSGKFTIVEDDQVRRTLKVTTPNEFFFKERMETPAFVVSNNERYLQSSETEESVVNPEVNEEDSLRLYTRRCDCAIADSSTEAASYFCDLSFTRCILPPESMIGGTQEAFCTNGGKRLRKDKIVDFLLASMGLIVVIGVVCTSQKGRNHAIDFVISLVNPNWNRGIVERIMQNDPTRANHMIRRQLLAQHYPRHVAFSLTRSADDGSQGYEVTPSKLSLKTRIFQISENRKEDGVGAVCSICLCEVEDGERVGVLPCSHIFHADCLKSWLKRRNVCPFCQSEHVAVPSCHGIVTFETGLVEEADSTSSDEEEGVEVQLAD